MQEDMMAAQESLKDEVVDASAGGGMVTVQVTGDLVRQVDQDRSRRRSTPRTSSCSRTWCWRRSTRGCAPPRSWRRRRWAGSPAASAAASAASGSRASRPRRRPCTHLRVQRLITELSKLPGVGGRTAQRLAFHILRASDEEAMALADAIREVKERIGLCEVCFNLADGPRCRICADERRDPELICVVEEPSDVISIERTHEFARPLPRARRRAVADRRRRSRGPEDRRALRPRRERTRCARW